MIALYLHIGTEILLRQKQNGWGSKVVARLSADLQAIFPGIKGFSTSNLKYMKSFAEKCPGGQIGQQAADQLPWFHIDIESGMRERHLQTVGHERFLRTRLRLNFAAGLELLCGVGG